MLRDAVIVVFVFSLNVLVQTQEFNDSLVIDAPSNGLLKGVRVSSKMGRTIAAFMGVPFGKAPVGKLRFMRPEAVERANGTFDATKARPGCLQLDYVYSGSVNVDNSDSVEDCLHLNIYYPVSADSAEESEKLPVFVFLYGGAYVVGENQLALYDGVEFAAETNAIFVVPNYRLNVLGLLRSLKGDIKGNMALWDQMLALKWIKRNIGAFGGDPDSVTLGGQSAGAFSAGILSYAPQAKGLFKRTWLMSGSPLSLKMFDSPVEELSAKIEDLLGCQREIGAEELECLQTRNITRKELMAIEKELGLRWMTLNPRPGDELLPNSVLDIAKNEYHVEEMMVGLTSREGDLFVSIFKQQALFKDLLMDSPQTTIRLLFQINFGMNSAQSAQMYEKYMPLEKELDADEIVRLASDVLGDLMFDCPTAYFAEDAARKGVKVRHYVYAHQPSVIYNMNIGPDSTHIDDIPFTLGSINSVGETTKQLGLKLPPYFVDLQERFSQEERHFARMIAEQISNYIRSGTPKLPGTNTEWPLFSQADPEIVYLAPNNFTIAKGPKSKRCAMWEPYIVSQPESLAETTTTSSPPTKSVKEADESENFIRRGKNLRRSHGGQHNAAFDSITASRPMIVAAISLVTASQSIRSLM